MKHINIYKATFRHAYLLMILCGGLCAVQAQQSRHDAFAAGLDSIRVALKIPAMSAAVMQGDAVVFQKALGFADLRNRTPATERTTFRIASITKTFTSTIIMQLVEQGKLHLDAKVSAYGLDFGNPNITVKHLLTHTSEGEPGTHFQYNGFRYGRLGIVIEKASGKPFYQLLMENIVRPLGMTSTAPGISLFSYFRYMQQRADMQPNFTNAFANLALPYELDPSGNPLETHYLDEFGAFGGLASNAGDLLLYAAAIDRRQFLPERTQQLIFSPSRTRDGHLTPYGLGWFTQEHRGDSIHWHFGQTLGESGLFVKVPSRKLNLVILTNTDKLSQPFPLAEGDLLASPAGQLFYRHFIDTAGSIPVVNYYGPVSAIRRAIRQGRNATTASFYNKELLAHAAMNNVRGDTSKARKLYQLYGELNFAGSKPVRKGKPLASLQDVGAAQERAVTFSLSGQTPVRVYGVGENCSGDGSFWCDYGWIEDKLGKTVWQMPGQTAKAAGGAHKNQSVDTVIILPRGTYTLRYKSDSGHAFNQWDAPPPDHFFWGIVIFPARTN